MAQGATRQKAGGAFPLSHARDNVQNANPRQPKGWRGFFFARRPGRSLLQHNSEVAFAQHNSEIAQGQTIFMQSRAAIRLNLRASFDFIPYITTHPAGVPTRNMNSPSSRSTRSFTRS